eukprot:XP_001692576.1 predicted protein [Chlamydomonas reinhardtii]
MVKTKGGRALNPADAFRKEQRKKEVQRNKMERKFIREGAKMRSDPESLKKELQELIDMEESATLPKNLKLKKKALQEAYDQALKRKKEEEIQAKSGGPQVALPGAAAGPVALRPEDSPYYHPTLNPSGAPPPGKGALKSLITGIASRGMLATPLTPGIAPIAPLELRCKTVRQDVSSLSTKEPGVTAASMCEASLNIPDSENTGHV